MVVCEPGSLIQQGQGKLLCANHLHDVDKAKHRPVHRPFLLKTNQQVHKLNDYNYNI